MRNNTNNFISIKNKWSLLRTKIREPQVNLIEEGEDKRNIEEIIEVEKITTITVDILPNIQFIHINNHNISTLIFNNK